MPSPRKPKAWNLKPQLTAAPELWRDCTFLEPFWESPRDIVHGFIPAKVEDTSWTASIGFGKIGREALFTRSGGARDEGAAFLYGGLSEPQHDVGSGDFTAFVYCRYVNKVSIASMFGKKRSGGFGSPGWSLAVNTFNNSQERVIFEVDNGTTQFLIDSAINTAPIDEPFVIVGRRRGGTAELFVNGASVASASVTGSLTYSEPISIGSGLIDTGSNTRFGFTGSVYMAGLSKRAWTDDDIVAFSRDPFAMLRPAGF